MDRPPVVKEYVAHTTNPFLAHQILEIAKDTCTPESAGDAFSETNTMTEELA
jgi:hypothetical protein